VSLHRFAVLILAAAPCFAFAEPAMPPADPEVDRQLAALHIRTGSPPDLRGRDRAMTWLLEQAERSFPLVLARAEAAPHDSVLIDLLGRYRRAESTPLLLQAFADERTRPYAAAGLGQSPDPAAHEALRRKLDSAVPAEVVAALSGLAASGDPARCADITPRLQAANAEVRWMALDAASRLACLDRAALENIARSDSDATVRALAAERLR
jgi:hypothetical protein